MSGRWLLDTNVVSEPLKPTPHPGVMARLRAPEARFFISALTAHELIYGVSRLSASARRTRLERYLSEVVLATMEVLPYDAEAASLHGAERARLEAQGRVTSFVDGAIAAVAVRHGLTLVTRNLRDFEPFAALRLEDWFA